MFAHGAPSGGGGFGRTLLILILVVVFGGVAALAILDFRPEPRTVEKPVPNERFR
jgi:hypothetical protein